MTSTDIGHGATTNDLGVSESEERNGVVGLLAITYKRLTIVVAEGSDDLIATGSNVAWPDTPHRPHIGLALAREKAIDNLQSLRVRGIGRRSVRA
jgi:hypothetical protein